MKGIFYKMLTITALITAVPLVLRSQTVPDSTASTSKGQRAAVVRLDSTALSAATHHPTPADSSAIPVHPALPDSSAIPVRTTLPDSSAIPVRTALPDSSASPRRFSSYQIRITPLVRTLQVTEISSNSAYISSRVISLFNLTVFARGVCWSTSENPTIAGKVTIDGHGAGEFTTRLTGLTPNTTYYIRAYAVNSEGFAHGQQVIFTTPEPEPEPEPPPQPEPRPEAALIPGLEPGAIVPIPDAGFKSYCLEWFDTNGDYQISVEEAAAVTEIKCPFYNIKSLQGIEYFTGLKNLSCCDNDLTTLDVTYNTNLVYLNCSNNRLSQIDLRYNTALYDLNCTGNQLKYLELSYNTALQTLFCGYNQLTTLDLIHNSELLWIICDCNQLTTLDVSNNPNLLRLECVNNLITSLNVNGAASLMSLDCSRNHLTTIDINGSPSLTSLVCRENNLTILDVSGNDVLTQLYSLNNLNLREIWLNSGQNINDLQKDAHTIIKYK
ncbi:MAG TPA: hypothetical protein PLQ82_11350 [Desulfobacteraceae bacterium]|nr:hypothetical protein [Desulfobacteraceae bacterium]HRW94564.1 hypothetical protein [Bacteroidales bacterium]